PRPRRTERGVRVAEPRGRSRARTGRGARERERRRHRARAPARDERRASRRLAAARAAAAGRPLRTRHTLRRCRAGRRRALRAPDRVETARVGDSVDMDVLVRGYRPEDRDTCAALWRELTQTHRDLYDDQSIGAQREPGEFFDEHLERAGADKTWVAELD